jgi:DNA-binding NtrC family response regulator
MPKMTGVELATEMMRIRPDVPVILTTGYSALVTPEKANQLGIRKCIMKPMLSAELGKAVRKVLDQDRGELRITTCILVIDDDPEVRSMLSDLLQRAGHEVIQCSDGRAAMKVLRERQINIVITDIIMPEKESIETIQELQQEFPEVRIIAISGDGRIDPSNYLSLAKAFGVQCTFEKPFDNDEMLQAVHELLYV